MSLALRGDKHSVWQYSRTTLDQTVKQKEVLGLGEVSELQSSQAASRLGTFPRTVEIRRPAGRLDRDGGEAAAAVGWWQRAPPSPAREPPPGRAARLKPDT